ncbi:arylsulfatase [Pseudomonas sp. S9]|uniref:arylsulfatase n=1 Tax=Pseudomonas sp. S9 TaxID=686578 RepID=UPI0002556E79|nr:arylsulfatase [Pseudomonas sp. S9]
MTWLRVRLKTIGTAALLASSVCAASLVSAADKPNILVIMGDDIGITNISKYSYGMMGYPTPNIDRIANEGMMFTDYYGEQSCTAGRAAFITGQHPVRTGLTKVGMPGSTVGLQKEDPTLAELLKPLGYTSGQFGKNHLGDRDEFLPTNHGFDEFLGNLYHLNAEEAPEDEDWTKNPVIDKAIRPRGIIHSTADGKVEDLGPLNRKRMETIDQEFLDASLNFMDKAVKKDKPFFVWFNSTRMHYYTHIKEETKGLSGQGFYNDGMVEHDGQVGELLKKLDDLGVAKNTIVIYTTDNGVHFNQWPDAGITPFRGEKNTNWEGGYRVPAIIRWPGHIKANSVSNEIVSAQDWVPTLMAAAGVPDVKEKLLTGYTAGSKSFKVHLDGYNQLPYLEGKEPKDPRTDFYYFSDDGKLLGMRDGDWKVVYAEQRAHRFDVWRDPFVDLRAPKLFNLRRDPFERADTDSNSYNVWWDKKAQSAIFPGIFRTQQFLMTFKDFPPRQRPASFTIDQMVEKLMDFKGK